MTVLVLDYIQNRMQYSDQIQDIGELFHSKAETMSIGTPRRSSSSSSSTGASKMAAKRPGKRPGRKPSKIDEHAKLERSRQSARECRARKKLRYQYLEELVLNREKAVFALKDELETYQRWCVEMGEGRVPPELEVKVNTEMAASGPSSPIPVDFTSDMFGNDTTERDKVKDET